MKQLHCTLCSLHIRPTQGFRSDSAGNHVHEECLIEFMSDLQVMPRVAHGVVLDDDFWDELIRQCRSYQRSKAGGILGLTRPSVSRGQRGTDRQHGASEMAASASRSNCT
jgi:hypothetical protein